MKVKIFGQDGKDVGRSVTLDKTIFEVDPNDHAIWLDVRRIQANARQGTHKTKERSEVAGSTRKLYRQKGTGNARAGSSKSPIRRSGGRTFGPRPHAYRLKVNRKTQRVARRSVLSYKAKEKSIRVVEDFDYEAPASSELAAFFAAQDLGDGTVLLLTDGDREFIHRSGRNLTRILVQDALSASTLDLLNASTIVIQESALKSLTKALKTARRKK